MNIVAAKMLSLCSGLQQVLQDDVFCTQLQFYKSTSFFKKKAPF